MLSVVTGGAGFVGSAITNALLDEGSRVRVLARRTSDLRNLKDLDVELHYGDLLEEGSLYHALRGCDVLYHAAAFYSTNPVDAHNMYETNIEGTKNVLRMAAKTGIGKVVHTSTIGAVGRPTQPGKLSNEETTFDLWETASPYAKAKYLAEVAALGFAADGLPVIVVNPCAPVGPKDVKPTSTGQRIVDYLRGVSSPFVPGGINHIAVEDVARGRLLAAKVGRIGERYILGHANGNLSRGDFYQLMEQVTGIHPPQGAEGRRVLGAGRRALKAIVRSRRRAVGERAAEAQRGYMPAALTCDPSKAIRELGLPQTPLALAFERAVVWFRENGYA